MPKAVIGVLVVAAVALQGACLALKGHHAGQGPTVDMFIRSYKEDLKWLSFSTAAMAGSMEKQQEVIRNALFVVPRDDVPLFEKDLDDIFQNRSLPQSLRSRFLVMQSKIKTLKGYEEQMLDKMHADLYTDAQYIVFFDTDTVFARDLTRDQLFDPEGRPRLCYRSVKSCGEACEMWMQTKVKFMLGQGDMLDQEYMCTLGQAYTREIFARTREEVEKHNGEEWAGWLHRAQRPEGSVEESPVPFTEFNALGAILWRDFHDKVHWADSAVGEELDALNRPIQTWSWEKNTTVVEKAMNKFECLISRQHDTEHFNWNTRNIECERGL